MSWISRIPWYRLVGNVFVLAACLLGAWLIMQAPHYPLRKYLIAALWGMDVLILLMGIGFMRQKLRFKTVLIQLLLLVAILEVGLRMMNASYLSKTRLVVQSTQGEKPLGWESKPNAHFKKFIPGYGHVRFSTNPDGFRVYETVFSRNPKILVVGDSFTQATVISDGEAYYDVLKHQVPNSEIFAYGATGYGSLQEYLILDKYLDQIQPNLILWQFCANDIINNHLGLSMTSHANVEQMALPFLINHQIQLRFPHPWGMLMSHSALLRFLDGQRHIFLNAVQGTIEDHLTPTHPLFQESLNTTHEIMAMVKARAGNIPVVAFSANTNPDLDKAFETACRENGIRYIPGIQQAVEAAKKAGVVVDNLPYDNHWNTNGHAIAGKMITTYLLNNGLLQPKTNREALP